MLLCCSAVFVAGFLLLAKWVVAADYAGMLVLWLDLGGVCWLEVCVAVAELHSGNCFLFWLSGAGH